MCCTLNHSPNNMASSMAASSLRAGSSILNYYTILSEDEKGKLRAKCNHCQTIITGSRTITSNFVTHLKVRSITGDLCSNCTAFCREKPAGMCMKNT